MRSRIIGVSASLLMLLGVAWSQTDIRVYQASLTAGGPVPGKLVLLGDYLIFVDDDRPETSLAVPKGNIESLDNQNDTITVQLRSGVRDRAGTSTRLIVRLRTPSEGAAIQRWYGNGVTGAAAAGSGAADNGATLTFSAQRKKRLRSNSDGQLMIDNERVIFESTDNASDSRRWELREIKELKLNNPFDLEVRTFRGEKYNLMLSGAGMDNSQLREIQERITRARTAR